MIKKFQKYEAKQHLDVDPLGEENWEDENNGLPYSYNTKLTITDRVINRPVYRNVFKVIIENMHGDADMYNDKEHYFENEQDVIKLYDFIKWANGYRKSHWRRSEREIYRIGELLFGDISDIIEGDATTDHQYLARPRVKMVTYFDYNGTEKEVNIK